MSWMRTAIVAAVVVLPGGCASPSPTLGPTDPRSGCGLGPVPVSTVGPEPCFTVTPRCPRQRPESARAVVWVATCSFLGRQGPCLRELVQLPGCPGDSKIVAMSLMHPSPDKRSCVIAADLRLDARATPGGGATVRWEAVEYDPVSCRIVGPELSGEATIMGPCCETVVDTYFPVNDFTHRTVIRTDWQP